MKKYILYVLHMNSAMTGLNKSKCSRVAPYRVKVQVRIQLATDTVGCREMLDSSKETSVAENDLK